MTGDKHSKAVRQAPGACSKAGVFRRHNAMQRTACHAPIGYICRQHVPVAIKSRCSCMSTHAASLVICEHCDAVYRRRLLARGERARCARCGAVLYRHQWLRPDGVLALSLTGVVLWLMANAWPIFSVSYAGLHGTTTLWGAVMAMWQADTRLVAALVAATLFFAPLCQLLLLAWSCGFACMKHRAPGLRAIVRVLHRLRPWSMVEVWIVGILVAVVKLHSVFGIHVGIGLWSFAALMVLVTLVASWDTRALWEAVPERRG